MLREIILDFGSGETCRNNIKLVTAMIDAAKELNDPVIKFQLFENINYLLKLDREVFDYAYQYAGESGLRVTASVFDFASLEFLLRYDIPFVKIACCEQYYPLIDYIPNFIPVMVSVDNIPAAEKIKKMYPEKEINFLAGVRKYPAKMEDYEHMGDYLGRGISDHCADFKLFEKYDPDIYETHFKLPNAIGADSGVWAKTKDQLMAICWEVKDEPTK